MMQILNKNTSKILTIYLILAFSYLQIFCLTSDNRYCLYASEQSTTCTERLDQAEEYYYDGEFDRAIEVVNQCLLKESLPRNEQIRSYTILARTYLAKEDTIHTNENIQLILKLDPSYQPTIEQETPTYVNLVAEIQKEQEQLATTETSAGISSWLLIGGGGLAALAIIAIATSGGSNEKGDQNTPLPKPPDFPE